MLLTYLFLCVVSLPSMVMVEMSVLASRKEYAETLMLLTGYSRISAYKALSYGVGKTLFVWQLAAIVVAFVFHTLQWDARWMAIPCGVSFVLNTVSFMRVIRRRVV